MAQKIKPNAFRLGITIPWASRWFFKRASRYFLEEDELIRKIIRAKILVSGIAAIDIERIGGDALKIFIKSSRPGLVIGRGGKGIDDLRDLIKQKAKVLRTKNNISQRFNLSLNIEELKRTEISAAVMAQNIAYDIEKRIPYRTVMKRSIDLIKQNRVVQGVKIRMSGRLNGAEISRADWLSSGKMPLQNLRADIDYAEATAFNSYGTVGIKVWIYKGEVFADKSA